MLVWELVGAVVGAGLASGREIASFFSQYGRWSIAGIVAAVCAIYLLANTRLPVQWRNGWQGNLWRILLTLLLIFTGGAMLSGAGEIAALTLPVHGAYWCGMAVTFAFAWFLANRTRTGLAWISRLLMAAMGIMIILGFLMKPMEGVNLRQTNPIEGILRGLTYGGFNAALQWPIMSSASLSVNILKRASRWACLMLLVLLLLANAVILRHQALMGEAMPFLRMTAQFGKTGYFISAACLYLAILSTLTACMRGLSGAALPAAGIVMVSLLGFKGVVDAAYPLLGGACCAMLVAAKLKNCFFTPFHSRKDML